MQKTQVHQFRLFDQGKTTYKLRWSTRGEKPEVVICVEQWRVPTPAPSVVHLRIMPFPDCIKGLLLCGIDEQHTRMSPELKNFNVSKIVERVEENKRPNYTVYSHDLFGKIYLPHAWSFNQSRFLNIQVDWDLATRGKFKMINTLRT